MSPSPSHLAAHLFSATALIGGSLLLAPLSATAQTQPSSTTPTASPQQELLITEARLLNPTTAELRYSNGQILTIDFYSSHIFRLFQDNEGGIVRNPTATPPAEILVREARRPVHDLQLQKHPKEIHLSTAAILLNIDRHTGALKVLNRYSQEWVLQSATAPSFDREGTQLTLHCKPDEYFYGGGVQNGRFSHRGRRIAIENTNNWVDGGVASPTPFYWSTAGYGLLWQTFKPGYYDFGALRPEEVVLRHREAYLDVFFMINQQPIDLLRDFFQLTGHPVLLPKFGFYQGHLNAYNRDYWTEAKEGKGFMKYEDGKWYNESQKDNGGIKESLNGEKNNYQFSARAAIDRYLDNDMPLGWFLPNDGYGAGYGQTETLDGNIANLRSFGDYARSKGVEIGLWTQSDLHPKPNIEALLQRDIVKEVRDAGVRVLKTDVAWVGWGYSFGLNGVADVAQIMPYYGNNARPFIISLDGWAGTQRYAGIWTGDQTGGEWEYIRFHIPTFIGSGLSGQPNISSDTDGIFGGKNPVVNVREFQWKTFTPMELNMDGWGANPKYPEALGGKTTALNRWYLKLKSELMPYAYTAAREAVNGRPMIRPMFMEERNAYTLGRRTQYQFMYGDAFLVAPIYQNTASDAEGNDRRDKIYLPKGQWVDYFTGDLYEGGCVINHFDAPLWKLPVLVKANSIIPMTHAHNTPTEVRKDYRAFEIYCQDEAQALLYDDDGNTQDYLQGNFTQTRIWAKTKKDRLIVNIEPTTGHFQGLQPQQHTELRINVTEVPKSITARLGKSKVTLQQATTREEWEQGENLWFYDARPNLNRWVKAGEESVGEVIKNPQVLIKIAAVDTRNTNTEVEVKNFVFAPPTRHLQQRGTLSTPLCDAAASRPEPYALTAVWQPIEKADYYEVEFDGMRYTHLRQPQFYIDELTPETTYRFRLRAVNAEGFSPWTEAQLSTINDPLEWAVKNVRATTSVDNQGGQDTEKLFDHDLKSIWHTAWNNPKATPFDLVVDLRAVHQLDRLVYVPREDAGNGTLLRGTYSLSTDRQTWSSPTPFEWARNGEEKSISFDPESSARYVKIRVNQATGNYGSGRELYIFRQPNTEGIVQGDINRDKRLDDNDLTSYMNYTGLRRGDGDYDYVSIGDINRNGLIDAYDISCVATELDGGVRDSKESVTGSLVLTPSVHQFKAGEMVEVVVIGKALKGVNALSFGLPYDAKLLEFVSIEAEGMKEMTNLTYDRLHSNGQKSLYPTFVNRGQQPLLETGTPRLFTIKFRAKRNGKYSLLPVDGLLVGRNLDVAPF